MKKIIIGADDAIIRKENQMLITPLGNELVMMNLESGDYIGLNTVASDIWNLLEHQTSVNSIIDQLMRKYEVSHEECEAHTREFLDELVANELLDRV